MPPDQNAPVATRTRNLATATLHAQPGPGGVVMTPGTLDATGRFVVQFSNMLGLTVSMQGGSSASGSGGASDNVYPLTMQPVAHPGDPVTLGDGPDQLVVVLGNNPNTPLGSISALILDGVAIAGPLAVTSWAGMANGQVFTINGDWGPGPHTLDIVGELTGDVALWIDSVTFNLVPMVTQQGGVNLAGYWASQGEKVTFGAPVVVAPPPPPPTLTIVQGSVGGSLVTGTLTELCGALVNGQALTIPAGSVVGTVLMPAGTSLIGARQDQTTVECHGLVPKFQQAAVLANGSGVSVGNLTIADATLQPGGAPGNNAAGLRGNGYGISIGAVGVTFLRCDNGVYSDGGDGATLVLTDCTTQDCGRADGLSHGVYANGGANTMCTLIRHTAIGGLRDTHQVKSRMTKTVLTDCDLTGGGNPDGAIAGSLIDVPDGGDVTVTGALTVPAGSVNRQALTYGGESRNNAGTSGAGVTVTMRGVRLVDGTGQGVIVQNGGNIPEATLDVTGMVFVGPVAPSFPGWGTIIGAAVAA